MTAEDDLRTHLRVSFRNGGPNDDRWRKRKEAAVLILSGCLMAADVGLRSTEAKT